MIIKLTNSNTNFLMCDMFKTLKYSNVGSYLDPCQTYYKVFGKTFQPIIIFAGQGHSFSDHF